MDRYTELRVIGRGSQGTVHLVEREGTKYVIKKIHIMSLSDEKEQESAQREVELLRGLGVHPNIVEYVDSFLEDDVLHIAMTYCGGGDLATHIKQHKKDRKYFAEAQILDWFVQMADAIAFVHEHKILHRDLKSNNVFLTEANVVKIGDFGIARVLETTLEHVDTVVGTPFYMSPEVCQSLPYSYKSDVWALGCILYEVLTLHHAFKADNLLGIVFKIVQGNYPPIPGHFSSELGVIVDWMLQREPTNRPYIHEVLEHQFIVAHMDRFVRHGGSLSDTHGKRRRRHQKRRHRNAKRSNDGRARARPEEAQPGQQGQGREAREQEEETEHNTPAEARKAKRSNHTERSRSPRPPSFRAPAATGSAEPQPPQQQQPRPPTEPHTSTTPRASSVHERSAAGSSVHLTASQSLPIAEDQERHPRGMSKQGPSAASYSSVFPAAPPEKATTPTGAAPELEAHSRPNGERRRHTHHGHHRPHHHHHHHHRRSPQPGGASPDPEAPSSNSVRRRHSDSARHDRRERRRAHTSAHQEMQTPMYSPASSVSSSAPSSATSAQAVSAQSPKPRRHHKHRRSPHAKREQQQKQGNDLDSSPSPPNLPHTLSSFKDDHGPEDEEHRHRPRRSEDDGSAPSSRSTCSDRSPVPTPPLITHTSSERSSRPRFSPRSRAWTASLDEDKSGGAAGQHAVRPRSATSPSPTSTGLETQGVHFFPGEQEAQEDREPRSVIGGSGHHGDPDGFDEFCAEGSRTATGPPLVTAAGGDDDEVRSTWSLPTPDLTHDDLTPSEIHDRRMMARPASHEASMREVVVEALDDVSGDDGFPDDLPEEFASLRVNVPPLPPSAGTPRELKRIEQAQKDEQQKPGRHRRRRRAHHRHDHRDGQQPTSIIGVAQSRSADDQDSRTRTCVPPRSQSQPHAHGHSSSRTGTPHSSGGGGERSKTARGRGHDHQHRHHRHKHQHENAERGRSRSPVPRRTSPVPHASSREATGSTATGKPEHIGSSHLSRRHARVGSTGGGSRQNSPSPSSIGSRSPTPPWSARSSSRSRSPSRSRSRSRSRSPTRPTGGTAPQPRAETRPSRMPEPRRRTPLEQQQALTPRSPVFGASLYGHPNDLLASPPTSEKKRRGSDPCVAVGAVADFLAPHSRECSPTVPAPYAPGSGKVNAHQAVHPHKLKQQRQQHQPHLALPPSPTPASAPPSSSASSSSPSQTLPTGGSPYAGGGSLRSPQVHGGSGLSKSLQQQESGSQPGSVRMSASREWEADMRAGRGYVDMEVESEEDDEEEDDDDSDDAYSDDFEYNSEADVDDDFDEDGLGERRASDMLYVEMPMSMTDMTPQAHSESGRLRATSTESRTGGFSKSSSSGLTKVPTESRMQIHSHGQDTWTRNTPVQSEATPRVVQRRHIYGTSAGTGAAATASPVVPAPPMPSPPATAVPPKAPPTTTTAVEAHADAADAEASVSRDPLRTSRVPPGEVQVKAGGASESAHSAGRSDKRPSSSAPRRRRFHTAPLSSAHVRERKRVLQRLQLRRQSSGQEDVRRRVAEFQEDEKRRAEAHQRRRAKRRLDRQSSLQSASSSVATTTTVEDFVSDADETDTDIPEEAGATRSGSESGSASLAVAASEATAVTRPVPESSTDAATETGTGTLATAAAAAAATAPAAALSLRVGLTSDDTPEVLDDSELEGVKIRMRPRHPRSIADSGGLGRTSSSLSSSSSRDSISGSVSSSGSGQVSSQLRSARRVEVAAATAVRVLQALDSNSSADLATGASFRSANSPFVSEDSMRFSSDPGSGDTREVDSEPEDADVHGDNADNDNAVGLVPPDAAANMQGRRDVGSSQDDDYEDDEDATYEPEVDLSASVGDEDVPGLPPALMVQVSTDFAEVYAQEEPDPPTAGEPRVEDNYEERSEDELKGAEDDSAPELAGDDDGVASGVQADMQLDTDAANAASDAADAEALDSRGTECSNVPEETAQIVSRAWETKVEETKRHLMERLGKDLFDEVYAYMRMVYAEDREVDRKHLVKMVGNSRSKLELCLHVETIVLFHDSTLSATAAAAAPANGDSAASSSV